MGKDNSLGPGFFENDPHIIKREVVDFTIRDLGKEHNIQEEHLAGILGYQFGVKLGVGNVRDGGLRKVEVKAIGFN
jgi:hypothetical protein